MKEFDSIKWEKVKSFDNGQYIVKEIRCPKCHHRETYIGTAPEKCIICDERRL